MVDVALLEVGDVFPQGLLHAAFIKTLQPVDEILRGILVGEPLEVEDRLRDTLLVDQLGQDDGAQAIEGVLFVRHVVVAEDLHELVEDLGAAVLAVEFLEILAALGPVADGVRGEIVLEEAGRLEGAGVGGLPDVVQRLAVVGVAEQRDGLAGGGVAFAFFPLVEFLLGLISAGDLKTDGGEECRDLFHERWILRMLEGFGAHTDAGCLPSNVAREAAPGLDFTTLHGWRTPRIAPALLERIIGLCHQAPFSGNPWILIHSSWHPSGAFAERIQSNLWRQQQTR
ncbi:hypothetical protein [Thiocystis minor]|uniref:hypothetical protein n=1 Tax=Thiocystis minor TaxID=61597 RepID=UPI001912A9AF|nr:hypothetical protein [Thiocystis minor]